MKPYFTVSMFCQIRLSLLSLIQTGLIYVSGYFKLTESEHSINCLFGFNFVGVML